MKYFKPKSLTWWTSVATLGFGIFETVMTKQFSPYIAAGLGGIGIRGALPDQP